MKIITTAGAVALLLALTACEPAVEPRPTLPTLSASQVAADVKGLCDFFATRPLEVLGTAAAEGNVTLLSDAKGVPLYLRDTARGYYDGGFGGRPDTAEHKAVLERRYELVMRDCRAAGTGWQRP